MIATKTLRCPIGLSYELLGSYIVKETIKVSLQPKSTPVSSLGRLPALPRTKTGKPRKFKSAEFKAINLELVIAYQSLPIGHPQKARIAGNVIRFNEGLCKAKAAKYDCKNLSFDDFLSLAHVGVYVALERFDSSLSENFASYAGVWIRKFCLYAIANAKLIHIPDSAQRLAKASAKLIAQGITDVDVIAETLKKQADYVIDAIEMIKPVQQIPTSEDGTEMDFVDVDTIEPEFEADEQHLIPIRKALQSLDPQAADICLMMSEGMKPKAIGTLLNLSSRKVNTIYKGAIDQLRATLEATEPTTDAADTAPEPVIEAVVEPDVTETPEPIFVPAPIAPETVEQLEIKLTLATEAGEASQAPKSAELTKIWPTIKSKITRLGERPLSHVLQRLQRFESRLCDRNAVLRNEAQDNHYYAGTIGISVNGVKSFVQGGESLGALGQSPSISTSISASDHSQAGQNVTLTNNITQFKNGVTQNAIPNRQRDQPTRPAHQRQYCNTS